MFSVSDTSKLFSIPFMLRTQAGTPHFHQPICLRLGIWKRWRQATCVHFGMRVLLQCLPCIQPIKHFCAAWVLIFPIEYHSQCVCSHCICAVSHNICVWGQIFPTYLKWLTPDWVSNLSALEALRNALDKFSTYLLTHNLYGCTIKINWVIPQNNV